MSPYKVYPQVPLEFHSLKREKEDLELYNYMIMHDLKSPIVSLLSLINISKNKIKTRKTLNFFEEIERYLIKLNNEVNFSLRTGVGSGKQFPEELTSLTDILSDVKNRLGLNTLPANIIISYPPHNRVKFTSKKNLITSILQNIISNSIRHARVSESDLLTIRIQTTIAPGFLKLEITDDGIGLSDDKISCLLDPDINAQHFLSKNGGLGLFIIKKCVEKLMGNIEISRLPQGTCFRIEIPI